MTKKIFKILFISNPESIHARRWAAEFAKREYEVHLLSPVEWQNKTITTHVIPLYPHGTANLISRLRNGINNILKARHFIENLSPDIIHLHGLYTVFSLDLMFTIYKLPNLVVSTWGTDIVFDPRKKEPYKSIFIKQFILSQARRILATSGFQSRVTKKYSPKHKKVTTTPFGVDLELFNKYSSTTKVKDQLVIGFVKKLEKKYGPDILVEAYKKVEEIHQNVKLMMIGNGSMRVALEERVKDLGIKDKVSFLGHVRNEEVPYYLNQMDIFAMPSIYSSETFGVAAIEAQACQVPVIASDLEGLREVVIDGITGYLIEKESPTDLAHHIIKLVENPYLRNDMGIEGRKFVAKHYDWNKNVDTVENIYNEML